MATLDIRSCVLENSKLDRPLSCRMTLTPPLFGIPYAITRAAEVTKSPQVGAHYSCSRSRIKKNKKG